MTPKEQAEQAELEALNTRMQQENQRLSHELATIQRELVGLQTVTEAKLAMEDTEWPLKAYIVRSTHEGIRNLERRLEARFQAGVELGRAQMEEEMAG